MEDSVLSNRQIDDTLQSYEVTKLEDIATKRWFNKSVKTIRLYKTAALEASQGAKERVVGAVISFNKVEHFIYDLITLSIWKEKVLPKLLLHIHQSKPSQQTHVVPIYVVLYTEIALIGLIQLLLFNPEMFTIIENELIIDLMDYCVDKLCTLNTDEVSISADKEFECGSVDSILCQHEEVTTAATVSCVTILRYICESLDKLAINIALRFYSVHDLPSLIADILDSGKWTKKAENGKVYKFSENSWKEWLDKEDAPLGQVELQTWLLMRQLLLNPMFNSIYYFSDNKKQQLCKLLYHLNPKVIKQLNLLGDLRYWLDSHSIISSDEGPAIIDNDSILKEDLELLSDSIYAEYEDEWQNVALANSKRLFQSDIIDWQTLSTDDDILQMSIAIKQTCFNCQDKAYKKCSKCKSTLYCSRRCQLEDWPTHKNICKQTRIIAKHSFKSS